MKMKMQAGARMTDRTWNGDAVGGVVLSICWGWVFSSELQHRGQL